MPDPLASAGGAIGAIEPDKAVAEVRSAHERLKTEIHKVIVGQDDVVDQVLMCIFCRLTNQ